MQPKHVSASRGFAIVLWFGVVAGLLELLFLVIRVKVFEKGFFLRSRHFVWMVPLSDVLIFAAAGALLTLPWPRLERWRLRIILGASLFLALLSQVLLVPGVYAYACVLFALGFAVQGSRWLAAHRPALLASCDGPPPFWPSC